MLDRFKAAEYLVDDTGSLRARVVVDWILNLGHSPAGLDA